MKVVNIALNCVMRHVYDADTRERHSQWGEREKGEKAKRRGCEERVQREVAKRGCEERVGLNRERENTSLFLIIPLSAVSLALSHTSTRTMHTPAHSPHHLVLH